MVLAGAEILFALGMGVMFHIRLLFRDAECLFVVLQTSYNISQLYYMYRFAISMDIMSRPLTCFPFPPCSMTQERR